MSHIPSKVAAAKQNSPQYMFLGQLTAMNIFFLFRVITERKELETERFHISILHSVICFQLLLLCFREQVSLNTFLNDAINIFCCKHLKYNFYA